jgi:hypothetical protein
VKRILACLGLAAVLGCGREPAGDGAEAAGRVGHLLYEQNLISDPEVNAKLMDYAGEVGGEGIPADSVLPELHRWLESWVAAHPGRVARARLMPRVRPDE